MLYEMLTATEHLSSSYKMTQKYCKRTLVAPMERQPATPAIRQKSSAAST